MIRRCTGEDPNLIMYIDPATDERIDDDRDVRGEVSAIQKPCDCGKVFNDELCSVIYPHRRI